MKACEKPTKKHPNGRTGTQAGAKAHRDRKEPICEECREAENKRYRERYYKKAPWMHPQEVNMECERRTKKFPNGTTGTNAGFGAHERAGETPCEPCLKAKREYNAARMRKNYSRYQESKLEYQKRYREEHKDLIKRQRRRYYLANRAAYEARKRARMERIKELTVEPFDGEDVTRAHGEICYLCETPVDLNREPGWSTSPQLDHVHPISSEKTPGHVLSNVRWTHARCNLVKGAKMMEDLELPLPAPIEERYVEKEPDR